MGAPVEATMDVVQVGELEDYTPVLLNKLAREADGIVLVNRIKPHTSFRGPFESGLMKMMTIGLGSHKGATLAHSKGAQGIARLIHAWGRTILDRMPVIMGIAVVENACDRTGRIVALKPEEFESREPLLLEEARQAMPRLLVEGIDLLIVEEMGKDISGTGMDTNVIGRMQLPGVEEPETPAIARIAVLDLTERTNGNASGLGLADIITRRLSTKSISKPLTPTFSPRPTSIASTSRSSWRLIAKPSRLPSTFSAFQTSPRRASCASKTLCLWNGFRSLRPCSTNAGTIRRSTRLARCSLLILPATVL